MHRGRLGEWKVHRITNGFKKCLGRQVFSQASSNQHGRFIRCFNCQTRWKVYVDGGKPPI